MGRLHKRSFVFCGDLSDLLRRGGFHSEAEEIWSLRHSNPRDSDALAKSLHRMITEKK